MTTTYDFPEPGLYFDAGIRTATELDQEITALAHRYGWQPEEDLGALDTDYEWWSELADEATEFLNSLESREGYSWGYGENAEGFGLWAEEEQ